ncbi:MAG: hypothetical protein HY706_10335 [Candidatus Hydrogenedentes bacterium]|nr:hypothetical protein [Candidatus Hydrogenedentota bacterium]
MKSFVTVGLVMASVCITTSGYAQQGSDEAAIAVGKFGQEVRTFYTTAEGLPSDEVNAVAVGADGTVYAATAKGLAGFSNGNWSVLVPDTAVYLVTTDPRGGVHFLEDGGLSGISGVGPSMGRKHTPLHGSIADAASVRCIAVPRGALFLGADSGFYVTSDVGAMNASNELDDLLGADKSIRDFATTADGKSFAVAAAAGVFANDGTGADWKAVNPRQQEKCWNSCDARGVAYDEKSRLWVAMPQGVACLDGETWELFTGHDGLPYGDFTSVATGPAGVVWFGTHMGAVRYDGTRWVYRQGLRWLPDDDVRDVAVGPDGSAWFATKKGVGVIRFEPMTLAQKAKFYEDEIDARHRRTPYEYVLEVSLERPGDKSKWTQHDSDNDGLWTGMYGASECFAYGATKDPKAKERAKKAFEALHFLGEVTQGGSNPAPKGFVARSILPTSGPDPNEQATPERDRRNQERDKKWKVIVPRWPKSADGQWYWKTDTSSDELDGHYFFYGLYYDLVAETEEEKTRVREHVRALTDNMVDHDFCLVDHDGLPTRWAVYSPKALNGDPSWNVERGLNSLSILAYLATAEHITGDPKYRQAADLLINEHHYAQNLLVAKIHNGIGSGNQSDDEMAFMSYYNLLKYEKSLELRGQYAFSLYRYWYLEEPEANAFFNFVYASVVSGQQFSNAFGSYRLGRDSSGPIVRSVEELKRFSLDRLNWGHDNSRRIDLVHLPKYSEIEAYAGERSRKAFRVDGYVIPVDERFFNHYNHDPWSLRVGGNGQSLADGTVFLLPYYMGLYHGFIKESTE